MVAYILCEAFDVGAGVGATSEVNSPQKRRPCARSYGSRASLLFAPDHLPVIFAMTWKSSQLAKVAERNRFNSWRARLKQKRRRVVSTSTLSPMASVLIVYCQGPAEVKDMPAQRYGSRCRPSGWRIDEVSANGEMRLSLAR